MDASGNIISGMYRGANGAELNTTGGLMAIAPNGKLTGSIELEGGLVSKLLMACLMCSKPFLDSCIWTVMAVWALNWA